MTGDVQLPLDLPEPITCWYCGGSTPPFQTEHQRPKSRGGTDGQTVMSCARCNSLKGPLDVEEFRQGLAERLGIDTDALVFAGEASATVAATRISSVRSLAGDRSVTRLDPEVGEELEKAYRYLRSSGDVSLSRKELASTGTMEYLDSLRQKLGLGEEWPEPNLSLFTVEPTTRTGRRELAQAARVPMERQHTKVYGPQLDHARAAVEHRRANGEPQLTLLAWFAEAMAAQLEADAARYPGMPTLEEAVERRYGVAG